ncbi:pyridoxamine 5'-phosphate oxidase family protein [Aeromicrobium sp.]|uniref:pyridoxamine 5'-phosphate oxidase family protein n=1 Tax=Aeromicrobium sp. TaxID=1871063 RepID=UPI00198DABCE|nr:pyridoxamine 5'-phosphate oxidase family protein [Aeromicrobium sp.]MBC7631737.1 pyridoxamine 5'-phosphate oxidase family protein [Aeromicrobium sp.]
MTETKNGLAGTLTEMAEAECLELLSTTAVGRIAFVNADGQQLIPVNFIVLDGLIYFRTVYTGLLSELSRGHDDVAFGVDHYEVASRTGWNVTAKGSAREVEDRATINKVLGDTHLHPWAGGVRSTVIEVRPTSVAGRRVSDPSVATPRP